MDGGFCQNQGCARGSWDIPAFRLDSLSEEGRASLLGQFGHNDKVGMETKKL